MAEGALEGAVDPGLLHHGDAEVRGSGLLDLAVNVHPHGPPDFLREALRAADDVCAYPDPDPSERTLARLHGRAAEEVLVTAGATEAFTLVARMRPWRRPVVVHPQFTEPHAALLQAGHRVQTVLLPLGRTITEAAVPEHADLVVVGNPTNPTGTLHPREEVVSLLRPGRVVLVDEFQDTDPVQWSVLRRAFHGHATMVLIGDPKQAIYAFRGANIRNILDFEEDFPDAATILLEQNYRSTQTILTAANGIIGHNKGRKPKRLWSDAGDGERIVGYVADDEHDEARFVSGEIDTLVDGGAKPGDVAVFYRTNAQSRVFEEIFIRTGQPLSLIHI